MVETDPSLADGYRIGRFDEMDEVSTQDVLDLWSAEAVIPVEEARRRADEVHMVATHADDGLVAVSTAYLQRNQQLGMDLWYYRAFTSTAHRISNLAVLIARSGFHDLDDRFRSGADVRGPGIVYEVENAGLKTAFPEGVWHPLLFVFVGENARGDHVRVRYFQGATVPLTRTVMT